LIKLWLLKLKKKDSREEKQKQDSLEKTLEDTIEQLEHDEFLYLKSIAKKYEIDIPDKLGKKYWRIFLKKNPLEYDKFISETLKYTEDYKLNFITRNSEGKYIKYDEIPSKLSKSVIKELVLQDAKDKVSSEVRINPLYLIQKKEQDTLRQLLSKKSKSDLLKCINDKDIFKSFSYIDFEISLVPNFPFLIIICLIGLNVFGITVKSSSSIGL